MFMKEVILMIDFGNIQLSCLCQLARMKCMYLNTNLKCEIFTFKFMAVLKQIWWMTINCNMSNHQHCLFELCFCCRCFGLSLRRQSYSMLLVGGFHTIFKYSRYTAYGRSICYGVVAPTQPGAWITLQCLNSFCVLSQCIFYFSPCHLSLLTYIVQKLCHFIYCICLNCMS